MLRLFLSVCFAMMGIGTAYALEANKAQDDPYLWLEEVGAERSLGWVRERNAIARTRLEAWPDFAPTRNRLKEILDSQDRIPQVVRRGAFLYNFWQDGARPRGIWRRASMAEFAKAQPAWEVLLDLDALAKQEQENWVWGGSTCLGGPEDRCLIKLSRGGADAKVTREFDLASKAFVVDGFNLPEAKSSVEWIDRDNVYVGTDFGPGSMTSSGYPRVIKRWRRGEALAAAKTVFEGLSSDVSAWVSVDRTPGFEQTLIGRSPDFWTTEVFLLAGGARGQGAEEGERGGRSNFRPVVKPADAQLSFWYGKVLLTLRSDWVQGGRTWPAGSLMVANAGLDTANPAQALDLKQLEFSALFTPSQSRSLRGYVTTRSRVLISVLDHVAGRLEERELTAEGTWGRRPVDAPFPGALSVNSLHDSLIQNDPLAEQYLLSYSDFLTPDSLFLAQTGSNQRQLLKARPAFFEANGMRAEQHFATSKDGTRVPYFVVWPKGGVANGANPTLLYGYGGFRQSLQPWYSAAYGNAWVGRGGVLVIANIRGGGEYGPPWHQAAIKSKKQTSYDDFIAIAEDLVARRITSPQQLGIAGGSNGGLLVGAVMVQRPELFGAVVCQVPLLDMKRYHKLLAGASWMAEYGDPDKPEDWSFISRFSPYQNVQRNRRQPPVLFTTSTRDDRVHPGHARKMAARMIEQGHEVVYYENIEGGHGGAANNAQRADMQTLEFAFLWQQLARPKATP